MKRTLALIGLLALLSSSAHAGSVVFGVQRVDGVDAQRVQVESTIRFSSDASGRLVGVLSLKNVGKTALLTNSASDQIFIVDSAGTNYAFNLKNPQADPGAINPFDQMDVTFLDRDGDFAKNLREVIEGGKVEKLAVVLDSVNLIFYYSAVQTSAQN